MDENIKLPIGQKHISSFSIGENIKLPIGQKHIASRLGKHKASYWSETESFSMVGNVKVPFVIKKNSTQNGDMDLVLSRN